MALDGLYLKARENWEQARMIVYAIAQSNSKERIKPSDILHFPWDEGYEKPEPEEDDEEYNEWIEEQMKQREKELNDGSRSSNTTMARQ